MSSACLDNQMHTLWFLGLLHSSMKGVIDISTGSCMHYLQAMHTANAYPTVLVSTLLALSLLCRHSHVTLLIQCICSVLCLSLCFVLWGLPPMWVGTVASMLGAYFVAYKPFVLQGRHLKVGVLLALQTV